MIRPRVIPCLLMANRRLVKTVRFREPRYVGDPVNIVNIFSSLGADEILLLDITAASENRHPDLDCIRGLAEEAIVPLGYGGGVRTLDDVRAVLAAGAEKVVVNTIAAEDPGFLDGAAHLAGSQAIVASIDVAPDAQGRWRVFSRSGTRMLDRDPVNFAREMESRGAGEILLYSIDRDGTMEGYDIEMIRAVSGAVRVPVIACGGAGCRADLHEAIAAGGASAAAAGSIFVFQGKNRSVVVNYLVHEKRDGVLA